MFNEIKSNLFITEYFKYQGCLNIERGGKNKKFASWSKKAVDVFLKK